MGHETGRLMAGQNKLWEAVATVIDQAGHSRLSERDLLRGLFTFEHTGSIRELAMQIGGTGIPDGAIADPAWQQRADADALTRLSAEREQLSADLNTIVKTGRLGTHRLREVHRAAERLVMVPRFRKSTLGHNYLADGASPALCYALLLLLDPARGYLSDIRRCEYSECQRLFFVSDANAKRDPTKPGLRRTKYCTRDHMMAAWKARKR